MEDLTRQVQDSFAGAPSPRFREVMESLVEHLHAFVREVRPTEDEWQTAIDFLARAGEITDARRQEFILLSDVLGVSMLTVTLNQPPSGTEATVVGPFFVDGAPRIPYGGDAAAGASGRRCWVEGTVRDPAGAPVAGARLDVWEADDQGRYDVQYDDDRIAGRAHQITDEQGRYGFWCVTPTPYPIPDDGPVGDLLAAAGRSPMRAAHLHFLVTAPGFCRLVTHIFVRGDPHLRSDAVFGVKESLIVDFAGDRARFDIVLSPAEPPGPRPRRG